MFVFHEVDYKLSMLVERGLRTSKGLYYGKSGHKKAIMFNYKTHNQIVKMQVALKMSQSIYTGWKYRQLTIDNDPYVHLLGTNIVKTKTP